MNEDAVFDVESHAAREGQALAIAAEPYEIVLTATLAPYVASTSATVAPMAIPDLVACRVVVRWMPVTRPDMV